jgi:hypothetical protein
VVAIAVVVAVLLSSDGEDEPQRVAVEGVEVTARAAGVSSIDPESFFLETPKISFAPGLTEVELGTCPTGNRAIGYAGPQSTNGNPSGDGFTSSDDQRRLIVPVENSTGDPLPGRLVLICSPI